MTGDDMSGKPQTGQWCNAKNIILVIVVYTVVISYIIYDFNFSRVDLSHYGKDQESHNHAVHDVHQDKSVLQRQTTAGTPRQSARTIGKKSVTENSVRVHVPKDIVQQLARRNTTEGLTETNSQTETTENAAEDGKIKVYGYVQGGKKYAVFGCTTPLTDDYTFSFYLPLSVLAWRRINYSSVVVIIGAREDWANHQVLSRVLNQLELLGTILIFIHSKPEHATMLSQTSRLFVPILFPWKQGEKEPYLTTSDADIWPISSTLYDLMPGTKIVSSNSECCGNFVHQGHSYKMLPMCYIGMTFSTWSEVMDLDPGQTINDSKFIINYLYKEFGDLVQRKVEKGVNDGWFIDQHLISIKIQQWVSKNSPDLIQYIRRDPGKDRIDRSYWQPHNIDKKKDSHLLLSPYKPGTWERLLPLMHQLFNQTTVFAIEKYRELFLQSLYQLQGNG